MRTAMNRRAPRDGNRGCVRTYARVSPYSEGEQRASLQT